MNPFNVLPKFIGVLLFSFTALCAAEEEPEMYVYSTYFKCIPEQESAVDELVQRAYAPIYNDGVNNGTIASWGWLKHHTGGEWRRILYHSAPSIDSLFAAQETMNKKFEAVLGKNTDALGRGCQSHEDYIWQYVTGSRPTLGGETRGKVSLSVYMECSFSGEEKADAIVKEHFAPVFNAQVGKGKLTSWGWLSHVVGGKYRRLQTATADNYSDLLKAKKNILDTLYDKDNKHSAEFSDICTSHQDYLWDIKTEL
ncbi:MULTISPECIES: hypothetical protein [Shewanella]|uniref:Uncharacterized protein n=1 Tax=Shewanella psychromarinicola TaxID=2487742 RepID=A0A3N4E4Q5_9GAMM|nr:hypothetical protein [Shewanella psychromarinicola]AZG35148.1 hypothetical protein EGC80_09595 [Shewanella psychromarinicola]MCL1083360.1 hypothetical protein [Shewanella psychromarinicola]RPA33053.1 hypothetical protein EGC77_06745 [Shewanella psychromarinicola]